MTRCSSGGVAALVFSLSTVALAQDTPIALDKWGRYHVNITTYMPNIAPGAKVKWVPKVSLVFRNGAPETDDVVQLQHYQGKQKWGPLQVCQIESTNIIKRRGKGGVPMNYSLVVPTCLMDEKLAIAKTGTFSVEVSYKQTGAGKVHKDLGRYTYQVKPYNSVWPGKQGPPTKAYFVDQDFRMGEAWLYVNADGRMEVWSWFKYDREGEAKVRGGRMRCMVNGKQLPFLEHPTGRTANHHDHYPTRNKNEKITWGLWYWSAPRVDSVATGDWIKNNPGSYRCTITEAGEISRELSFEVGADGAIKPAPCQGTGPTQVRTVEDEFLIKLEFKKIPDLKFDRAAFKKNGLYGRKWARGCPL